MIVEVIGTSIRITEPFQPVIRLDKFLRMSGPTLPVIGLGLFGSVVSVLRTESRWITVGAGWFLLQVFRLDLDGSADLLLLVVFASLGIGILVDLVDEETMPIYLIILLSFIALVINIFTLATPVDMGFSPGSLEAMFWNQQITDRCHVRMSETEQLFIQKVGERENVEECRYQIRWIITG
jgi:hypothetical protein